MAEEILNKIMDYSNKDYASLREAMLALAKQRMPEWTDHSANDMGVLLLELYAQMSDMMLYYQDRIAAESYLETAVEPRSIVNLLRLIGYELRPHQPASADLTLLFARSKDDIDSQANDIVTIATGTEFQTTAQATGEPVNFQYLRDPLKIRLTALPTFLHSDGVSYYRLDRLPVIQVDATVSHEIIGSSDGSPGQRFTLRQAPIIDNQLVVSLDESGLLEQWQQRKDLLNSLSSDKHYIIRRDDETVYVEFGDGRHGKVPLRGRNNITASYRVGGGTKGNVAAYTIAKPVTAVNALTQVFNAQPATGGADAESSETAAQRGPKQFRSMQRAVTAEDYEAHALAFGLAKARARAVSWNHIDIFVAPIGGGQPTDTLKEDLRNYFNDKRMMSSIVDIRDPEYVNVCMAGTLEIDAYHFTEQVQQRVANAVANLLAFDQVDFQYRLYLSKIYEAIEALEGVSSVYVSQLAIDSTDHLPANGKLEFAWNEIPSVLPMSWRQDDTGNHWIWTIPC